MATVNKNGDRDDLKTIVINILRLSITAFLVLFWSSLTAAVTLLRWVRKRGNFFVQKERQRPVILDQGWTHKYAHLSTVKLHYVEAGQQSNPLMLFIHGFPEFWYSWRFQLRHFQNKYHVVAVDQRGYNLSDKPNGIGHYKSTLLARDMKELIEKLGHNKATVVGHDWGGAVAWRLADDYPEAVERLIVMNFPHTKAFRKVLATNIGQFLKSWYVFMFQCPLLPEAIIGAEDLKFIETLFRGSSNGTGGMKNKSHVTDADIEAWKWVFGQPGALTPPLNYYRALLQSWHPEQMSDKLIKPPTLLIWGTEDKALAIEGARMTPSYCERCEVRYVEGASHWVQQDEPEHCNRLMDEFLRSTDFPSLGSS